MNEETNTLLGSASAEELAAATGYPQPLPVITADALMYLPGDPNTVAMVRLRCDGDDKGRGDIKAHQWALPGGIYDIGRHRDPLETAVAEQKEETGARFTKEPTLVIISMRSNIDCRHFRGFDTTHCLNFVVAGPATGELNAEDVGEIGELAWKDIRELDEPDVGRGHYAYIEWWRDFVYVWEQKGVRLVEMHGRNYVPHALPLLDSKVMPPALPVIIRGEKS